ncbi:hypothetical protein [Dokdonella sp.]|uniref:hypothetical protein n=1 Tax=Dokdonella sp. TaxID=2291710 RepID=UPI001B1E0088|nr:hypothetical protein [Dokdonella sp.]MBO9661935.1 hypothetical protein [Dokdonella sp.]
MTARIEQRAHRGAQILMILQELPDQAWAEAERATAICAFRAVQRGNRQRSAGKQAFEPTNHGTPEARCASPVPAQYS